MKKTLKRTSAMFLTIVMCMCICSNTSALAVSTDTFAIQPLDATHYLGNVVFSLSGTNYNVLPSTGTRTITLSQVPTMVGYSIILASPYKDGSVSVTFTNTNLPQYEKTLTLIADGTYHTANLSGLGLGLFATKTLTVTYKNPSVPLLSISISFAN